MTTPKTLPAVASDMSSILPMPSDPTISNGLTRHATSYLPAFVHAVTSVS